MRLAASAMQPVVLDGLQGHQGPQGRQGPDGGVAGSAGAQDTIYLCNFRVSVDGEWLCLKELDQDGLEMDRLDSGAGDNAALSPAFSSPSPDQDPGPMLLSMLSKPREAWTRASGASAPSGVNPSVRSSDVVLVQRMCSVAARDPAAVERSNLLNISKLIVKELIETSLKYGRMLDSDHMPLQHFFIVLEHVLRHGLRPKKVS